MAADFLPILIYAGLAIFIAAVGMIGLSAIVGPRKDTQPKLSPYECGIDPVGSVRERFPIRFYLIGVLFLLFDLEVVFLYPWAVVSKKLGLFALAEMAAFVAILVVGYIWAWRKGALEWE
jgi:NADH-quinone oxidoreductase subunit A